jgi:hypothetical protein
MSDLYKTFQTLIHEMKTVARSISCKANNLEDLLQQLPTEPGVFIVRHGDITLHIGSVGRNTNKGIHAGGTIRGKIRYSKSPIHFQADKLLYKPQGDLLQPSAYLLSAPLSEVSIICYINESTSRWLPSTLQSLLIQGHLNQYSHLPVGNLRS